MDLIVVDGPNLYNVVGARLEAEAQPDRLKRYLCDWFDLDRVVFATLGEQSDPHLGIVGFHSKRPLGRGGYHLKQEETDLFWGRQGGNPNTSCKLVDIPGAHQETYSFDCKNCGLAQQHRSGSEKGVDTSITTYLLETSDRWESVCIVSKDVDFVPPVEALRRRGKRVFCAVEEAASVSALVRACQSSYHINVEFLKIDLAWHEFFAGSGALDRMVTTLEREADVEVRVQTVSRTHRKFMRNDRHFEIGVRHRGAESEAMVRKIVNSELRTLPTLAATVEWEARSSELLFLHLSGSELLQEGLRRHFSVCAGARWVQFQGSIVGSRE